MQAIMETLFDAFYLSTVITLGVLMIRKSGSDKLYRLFGVMAVTLGAGDAFHLIPRSYALCTSQMESMTAAMGIGKFITSITMTVFYLLLYYVWRLRYKVQGKGGLTVLLYLFTVLRIALCLFPQNQWTSGKSSASWEIYRNLPFAAIGVIMIVLFFMSARKANDRPYRFMWLTIALSFAFYIPVVLLANTVPAVGFLMIPKTCAYVWTVLIGYTEMKRDSRLKTDK